MRSHSGQPGNDERRLNVAAVDYQVRTHASAAGLAGVGAHDLRHAAASLAIDAGEPLHRLRARLGHSSVLVTSRYLHVADRDRDQVPPSSTAAGSTRK